MPPKIYEGWTDRKGVFHSYESMDIRYLENILNFVRRNDVPEYVYRLLWEQYEKKLKVAPRKLKKVKAKVTSAHFDIGTLHGYIRFSKFLEKQNVI